MKRVVVVGGGPAGIFLSRQMKRFQPSWRVELHDQNPEGSTYGFGVSLGGQVLSALDSIDPDVHADLLEAGVERDSTQVLISGDSSISWSWGGWRTVSIARHKLLALLLKRAHEVGVDIHLSSRLEVGDARLDDADVIVAADGSASAFREHYHDEFRPSSRPGRNWIIWLGAAAAPVSTSTFAVRSSEFGPFVLHAYPYGDGMATMAFECDDATFHASGLAAASRDAARSLRPDELSRDVLSALFADELGGAELLMSNSRWFSFSLIRCERWSTGNLALLGDAAHTAHPSIGSGTRMAMEDGASLANALSDCATTSAAFARYEAERRPLVHRLQDAALPSQRWWETIGDREHLAPRTLALSYITRTGLYGHDRFSHRDPAFVRDAIDELASSHGAEPGTDPVDLPLQVGPARLPTRRLDASALKVAPDGAGNSLTWYAQYVVACAPSQNSQQSVVEAVSRLQQEGGPTIAVGVVVDLSDLHPDGPTINSDLDGITASAAGSVFIVLRGPFGHLSMDEALELSERVRQRSRVPVIFEHPELDDNLAASSILSGRLDAYVGRSSWRKP